MCHNGRKVTDELEVLRLDRVPHPPYSPDLSPCDFSLFGMLKQKIKDRVFQTIEEILDAIRHVWRKVTFEQLQSGYKALGAIPHVLDHQC
jgi:histone-lysine N-methyltransferase SETMAR